MKNFCILIKFFLKCGFTATFITGHFFFEKIAANGTQSYFDTEQLYSDKLRYFVIPQIQHCECHQEIVFTQYSADLHIYCRVKQFLRQHFTDAPVINCHFPIT